jgi:N-formylglutamate deformylase
MSADFLRQEQREGPLLLSMPHPGTIIPDELAPLLTATGRAVDDTDWWIPELYDFATALNASVLRTTISRYVIDCNRDPSGASLYPGQATTELCPVQTFDGEPLYEAGTEPTDDDIAERRVRYFQPYHDALMAELARIKSIHGYALLFDCHSIRSIIPRLFEGRLPIFNIGTNSGASCADGVAQAVVTACAAHPSFDHALNGRFKGGWITRHYGRPASNVHAVQLELAQLAYMEETRPWRLDTAKAEALRPTLRTALAGMIDWAQHNLRKNP